MILLSQTAGSDDSFAESLRANGTAKPAALNLKIMVGAPFRARPADVNHRHRSEGRSYDNTIHPKNFTIRPIFRPPW